MRVCEFMSCELMSKFEETSDISLQTGKVDTFENDLI
jgi:hypothetical protein